MIASGDTEGLTYFEAATAKMASLTVVNIMLEMRIGVRAVGLLVQKSGSIVVV